MSLPILQKLKGPKGNFINRLLPKMREHKWNGQIQADTNYINKKKKIWVDLRVRKGISNYKSFYKAKPGSRLNSIKYLKKE